MNEDILRDFEENKDETIKWHEEILICVYGILFAPFIIPWWIAWEIRESRRQRTFANIQKEELKKRRLMKQVYNIEINEV